MTKKRIVILGAGLAGLSAAWHLQEKGYDCRVFEKEPEPGGLCRSKCVNGFTFDYDGHLLHFKHKYIFNLVKSVLGNNLAEHERSAWIYSKDSYTRYPFQANLYGLSPSIVKECLLGFIEADKGNSIKNKNNLTFRDWINLTFGKGIARHFMIPYNAKFWTLRPQELTCAWLDGFIPVPSLSQTIEGSIEENKRQFGYNARFWYPRKGGIGQLASALAGRIKNIHTNFNIARINLDKKEIKSDSGHREKFDYLISTIPLPELPGIFDWMPHSVHSEFNKLKWNSILNLNLGITRKENLLRHWIYFPQKEVSFFRVGFFHNFSSFLAPEGKGSLYAEVSYSKEKPLDKNKAISRIKEDLKKLRIIGKNKTIYAQDVNDIKYGYPIYDRNYGRSREKILKFLLSNNIIPCGRYGAWRYMSMEDVLLEGKVATETYF